CCMMLALAALLAGCAKPKLPERPPIRDPEAAVAAIRSIINQSGVSAVVEQISPELLLWREQVHVPELAWRRLALSVEKLSDWTAREQQRHVWRFQLTASSLPKSELVPEGYLPVM